MKSAFDLFYENVKWLCKMNGIQVGQLEKEIGVSAGYISRTAGKNKDIGLFKAYKIASIFGVTLDDLSKKNLFKQQRIKELEEAIRFLQESD